MKKFKVLISDIIYISKATKVKNKKIRIVLSAFLTNATAAFDILIIILFSNFFIKTDYENFIINFFIENEIFLAILIPLRFITIYLDKLNVFSLQLSISENLKLYLVDDIYKKGNYSIADATYHITKLTDHIAYFYGALSNTLSGILQVFFYLIFLSSTNFNAIAVFFGFAIFLVYPTRYLLKKGRENMHFAYEFGQNVAKTTERLIENLFLIKILKTKTYEKKLFNLEIKKFSNAQFKNYYFGTLNTLTPNFAVMLSFSVLILFFNFVRFLTLDFMAIVIRMVQSLGSVNSSLNMLFNSQVHISKIKEIEENFKVSNNFKRNLNSDLHNAIELKNVEFQYFNSEKPIFSNLNLDIKKGEHVVLTGPNGSGKSTLIGILSGTLNPNAGSVDIFTNKIGYVGVKPLIIPDSLESNLMYGTDKKTSDSYLKDIVELFKLFDDDNWSLKKEINNSSLSSGQAQKISFMRAFISDAELLFLDESSSNLDKDSKKLVFKILQDMNITIINSTHNPEDFKYHSQIEMSELK